MEKKMKTRIVSVTIQNWVIDLIDRLVEDNRMSGLNRSKLIQRAIVEYIQKLNIE